MSRPRIYHPAVMETGETYRLTEDRRHYLGSVLRMRQGDRLSLFDGCGNEYEGRIGRLSPTVLEVEIVKKYRLPEENRVQIVLCQSVPKAGKMEFIIQKATELGIDRIIPFMSARTVARPDTERALQKVARWRKIAVEAAQQCGRADVPDIKEVVSFSEVLALGAFADRRMIFWEEETKTGLRQIFSGTAQSKLIFVVVGPEGGFAAGEIEEAVAKGFRTVSLGWRVLRVETAALAVISIIQYETGGLGNAPTPLAWEDRP